MYNLGNAQKNKLGLIEDQNKYANGEYIPDINSQNDSHSIIAREILKSLKKNIKILDIGCGSGVIGDFFGDNKDIIIDGVESDSEAIKELKKKKRYRYIYQKSVTDLTKEILKNEKYDFIITADLLEHLIKPYEVINNLTNFLNKNGQILISIPNITHIDILKNLINGKFNYNYNGTLDMTHLRFFTLKSFAEMIDNLNQNRSKLLDLELIGVTKTYPDDIDYNSELYKILNQNNNANIFQYILKLKVLPAEEQPENLEKLIAERQKDNFATIYSRLNEFSNCLIDNQKLFNENSELLKENSNLQDEISEIKAEYEKLRYITLNMLNSNSWRLTSPFRKVKTVIINKRNKK